MDQCVVLLDPQGYILEINQTDHPGMRDGPQGHPRRALMGPQMLAGVPRSQLVGFGGRFVDRPGEVTRYETEVYGASCGQQIITIDLTLKPLRDKTGEVVSLLVEGRDITERKTPSAKSSGKPKNAGFCTSSSKNSTSSKPNSSPTSATNCGRL